MYAFTSNVSGKSVVAYSNCIVSHVALRGTSHKHNRDLSRVQ